ncbi:hypothetical protein [Streptomyces sp. S.PNR 29]|uniref:hypothetical protein n=1 Tax=Streptomyces sp. S.PNR 29 TaxID=2973805 RepID=UPI0025AFEB28|nr:hypothetical protein [Streptomyces sp. S.PNR 29]MDN0200714.1 hypothetical protein [Streptomyces sp. S.PNR 29]
MSGWKRHLFLATLVTALIGAPVVPTGALSTGTDPAPMGTTATGTWWKPSEDEFSASSVWFFDPIREKIPYGWRKDYQPTGSVVPFEKQFSFTYTYQWPNQLLLTYPTGTRQTLTLREYDKPSDALEVDWNGHIQTWYGCSSGKMPAAVQAACR